jgi:cytochrome c
MRMRLRMAIFLSIVFFSSPGLLRGQVKIPKKTPELLTLGKTFYEQNCALCHGLKGDGKGQIGPSLKPPPQDFNLPFKQWPHSKGDLKKVFEIISKGIPNTSMIKWDHLSEQVRWGLVYYIVDFSKPKAPSKKQ